MIAIRLGSALLALFAGFMIGTLFCALAQGYQLLVLARALIAGAPVKGRVQPVAAVVDAPNQIHVPFSAADRHRRDVEDQALVTVHLEKRRAQIFAGGQHVAEHAEMAWSDGRPEVKSEARIREMRCGAFQKLRPNLDRNSARVGVRGGRPGLPEQCLRCDAALVEILV